MCGSDESLGGGDRGFETDYQLVKGAYGYIPNSDSNSIARSTWVASRMYHYGGTMYGATTWYFRGRLAVSESTSVILSYGNFYGFNTKTGVGTEQSAGGSVWPIVTLKSSVEISGGDGTYSSPYTLK